jgi:hypothetical protein
MKITAILTILAMFISSSFADTKMRLLVDKVFSRGAPEMSRNDFSALKKAGFNVVCDRKFGENPQQIIKYLNICRQQGLDYVPWLRGTLRSKRTAGQLVYENGVRVPVAAPLSPELWNYIRRNAINYAKISRQHPNLIGIFLDFEMYCKPIYTHAYPISYDDDSWRNFFSQKGLKIPQIKPSKRKKYLESQKQYNAYWKYYVSRFRQKCKKLRADIDKLNPKFQFIIYGGDFLVKNEFIPAMHTKEAPVVCALANTYGPPCPLLPEADNIQMAKELLQESRKEIGKDVKILAGLDPAVRGCTPEYAGKMSVIASETVDGFWVFYEGFDNKSSRHRQHIEEFTRGNKAIENKNYSYAREPFKQKTIKKLTVKKSSSLPMVGIYGGTSGTKYLHKTLKNEYETHDLQNLTLEYIKNFDILFLQNLNVLTLGNSKLKRILREYVAEGGSILLAHDSGWYMHNLFPEIAKRRYPVKKVSAVRHVMDTKMITAKGKSYNSAFPDHVIFYSMQNGKCLVKNKFGEDVIIIGTYKKGKVAFCGNHFAHKSELTGTEKEILFDVMKYLQ